MKTMTVTMDDELFDAACYGHGYMEPNKKTKEEYLSDVLKIIVQGYIRRNCENTFNSDRNELLAQAILSATDGKTLDVSIT